MAQRRHVDRATTVTDDITHQLRVAGVIVLQDHLSLGHLRIARQRGGNLAQLNAEPAQFYLLIGAA